MYNHTRYVMWGRKPGPLKCQGSTLLTFYHILSPELFHLRFSDDDHKKLTVQKQTLDEERLTLPLIQPSGSQHQRCLGCWLGTLHPGSGRTITGHPVVPKQRENAATLAGRPLYTDIARLLSTHKDTERDPESSYSVILPWKL